MAPHSLDSSLFVAIYKKKELTDAQFVLAKEYGISSWVKLKSAMESNSPLNRAVKALQSGQGCILFDDERRENEGDLVFAAEKLRPEQLNFMSKQARGTICVALSNEMALAKGFLRQNMNEENLDFPPFAQSIDHSLVSTGISINDRSLTISKLATEGVTISEFRSPGHIKTFVAKKKVLQERKGHTEGSWLSFYKELNFTKS